MREILFRGKRKDNDNPWIYGHLHKMDGYGTGYTEYGIQVQATSTSRPWSVLVIPETVGQYTGLTDKRGKKVFEGDIVLLYHCDGFIEKGVIGWSNIEVRYKFASPDGMAYAIDVTDVFDVIGNIHDNPELLEVAR